MAGALLWRVPTAPIDIPDARAYQQMRWFWIALELQMSPQFLKMISGQAAVLIEEGDATDTQRDGGFDASVQATGKTTFVVIANKMSPQRPAG